MTRASLTSRSVLVSNTTVLIRIDGLIATVSGVPRPVLRDTLESEVVRFEAGGPTGCRHSRELMQYWSENESEANLVTIPTGLAPRLANTLRTAGFRVEIKDGRRFDHDPNMVAGAVLLGGELAGQLSREPRGLIEATGRDASDVAAGIARLYPEARILVIARNRQSAKNTYRRLKWRLGDKVSHCHQLGAFTRHVIVVTLPQLSHATPNDFDIVLALDAWAATRQLGREGLFRFGARRVYGCIPPGESPGRREQLTLEAYFGPILHRDPKDATHVDVRVVMAIPAWSPPVLATDPLMRKKSIWRDDSRNRSIAAIATALSIHEASLFSLGLPEMSPPPGAVAVLVESPEHGRILQQLLPSWRLVMAGNPDSPLPPVAIITLTAAVERKSLDVGVLIRADGGAESLGLSGFPPGRIVPCSTVLLVDLADDGDPYARRATTERVAWYEGRGWSVEGRPAWTRAPR